MITVLKRFSLLLAVIGTQATAADRKAGDFDYFVLALSWNATWCALDGDQRGAPQCDAGRKLGFVLHGLWPQYERGWPSYCKTVHRDPSRAQTAAMADIMGSGGSAWHQWKKHGRCSGLEAREFFDLSRQAYSTINRPEILRQVDKPLRIDPRVIEDAFIQKNPGLGRRSITVTCKDGYIQEARICLTRDLKLRDCAPDTAKDCSQSGPRFLPMR